MRVRSSVLAAGLAAFVLVSGCGGPTLAPVTGTITCKGKPVNQAMLTFDPVPKSEGDKESGKPATGITDEAGNFYLSTFKDGDGALIGSHRVTVVLDDTNPAKCAREKKLTWEIKAGSNEVVIELDK